MLYDRRWDKPEVKADPFKLETPIAWLEQKQANQGYDYGNCYQCALAQYFKEYGYDCVTYSKVFKRRDDWSGYLLPQGWDEIARGSGKVAYNDHYFGKALERAKALQMA